MFIRGADGVLLNTDCVVSFFVRQAQPNNTVKVGVVYEVCANDMQDNFYVISKMVSKDEAMNIIIKLHYHIEAFHQYLEPEVISRRKDPVLFCVDDIDDRVSLGRGPAIEVDLDPE